MWGGGGPLCPYTLYEPTPLPRSKNWFCPRRHTPPVYPTQEFLPSGNGRGTSGAPLPPISHSFLWLVHKGLSRRVPTRCTNYVSDHLLSFRKDSPLQTRLWTSYLSRETSFSPLRDVSFTKNQFVTVSESRIPGQSCLRLLVFPVSLPFQSRLPHDPKTVLTDALNVSESPFESFLKFCSVLS